LQDIDLKIRKGEFVCIIGDVACGKSSLLSAIIGDMMYLSADKIKTINESQILNE
jgi:ATP-binding cassette, subfamily C (CFTR/MRP), member 1